MADRSKADMNQTLAAYTAYTEAVVAAGIMIAGDRLHPSMAATTRR